MHGFWRDRENQIRLLKEIASKLQILKPSDWGNISCELFIQNGGRSLIRRFGSVYKTLNATFPGKLPINRKI